MPVLYRKYRPSEWSEVMGQDHIVDALKESISADKISHAYLFAGSRGTGKTSIARILAKSLNTADEDINEIDAASNRGIDNIRELREHVSVLPFSSKYKVYIIDEVHMLSKDAWNALLKTLEEPPRHVIFILATTELDKVPDTIVSRCQSFSFARPTRAVIKSQILKIAKQEGYEMDQGTRDLIALLGDGSFRDALGILEKVISASADKKLVRAEVEKITGAPRVMLVEKFINALAMKDADSALAVLGELNTSGVNMNTFCALVLELSRHILLAQYSPTMMKDIEKSVLADDMKYIREQASAKAMSPAILTELLRATEETGRAFIPSLPLELAVVRICG